MGPTRAMSTPTPTPATPTTPVTAPPLPLSGPGGPPGRHTRRASSLGIGIGFPSSTSAPQSASAQAMPKTAFSSSFPTLHPKEELTGEEVILYSYAQLSGYLILPSSSSSPSLYGREEEGLGKLKARLRRKTRHARGGGSLDLGLLSLSPSPTLSGFGLGSPPALPGGRPKHHRRASSGLLGYLSPPSLSGLTSSLSSSFSLGSASSSPASVGDAGRGDGDDSVVGGGGGEERLPVLDIPPAMLAVDLVLAPGETKSCESLSFIKTEQPQLNVSLDSYTLKLPECLPPTYRGRNVKFGYELVVGTCRRPVSISSFPSSTYGPPKTPSSAERGSANATTSRVMKVPLRVYNHVSGKVVSSRSVCDNVTDVLDSW